MNKLRTSAGLAVMLVAAGGLTAQARPSNYLVNTAQFEAAHGAQPRATRRVVHNPVAAPGSAWATFRAVEPGTWFSVWDDDTKVPLRIYGSGIEAPGSVGSPAVAEKFARAYLDRHLGLLAPGAQTADFALASNVEYRGLRSVGFYQHHKGLRVIGGQVSFRFKNDRMFVIGSEALPGINAVGGAPSISAGAAETRALSWIQDDVGSTDATIMQQEGPYILPIIRRDGSPIEYRTVLSVRVDSTAPVGRWDVYVDAHTGEPVARRQKLFFGVGTAFYNTPVRRPNSERANFPAPFATVNAAGQNVTTDLNGQVSFPGNQEVEVFTRAVGPFTSVLNAAQGGQATQNFGLSDGGTLEWNEEASEFRDAQVTAFVHTNIAQQFARDFMDPTNPFLNETMQVTVNINDICNANSNGSTELNFFRNGSGCENTARLPDVVYHEFGHSIHGRSIIEGVGGFEGAMSEGAGDFLSALITGDAGVGRGFFLNDPEGALRDIDPVGREKRAPDDLTGEVHDDGEIYAGAMFDMHKALVAELGEVEGKALSARLFHATLQRATGMFTAHVELLAEDDDDGNLANGTPNECAIHTAFIAHGLADAAAGLGIGLPLERGVNISLAVREPSGVCALPQVSSAIVRFQVRGDLGVQTIAMNKVNGIFTVDLPIAEENVTVLYQIEVRIDDGSTSILPSNPADPAYQKFFGDTVELYCTDFETDPFADGWTDGGQSDWEFGVAAGGGGGDPPVAFSGTRVFGNNVGGTYAPNITNFARSPAVDTSGFDNVRVQYRRWLNVEDALFDSATVAINGTPVFENLATQQGGTNHVDREWRFQDFDVTPLVQNDQVQVEFGLSSDQGLQLGGWSLDDFCVVSFVPSECGDGRATGLESCDDGDANSDTEPDACRVGCRLASCGDGVTDTGEQCDDGNDVDDDRCSNSCLGEDVAGGGCGCAAGAEMAPGAMLLWLMAFFGVVLVTRRRRRR